MEIEIRHLRVVCAIAETGSLTRAASSLGLSQPNVSAQLQRIERMLGGALFVRSPHGVSPTALGELVLARARAVLPALDDLRLATALLRKQNATVIRVGTVAGPIVGGLIRGMRDLLPGVELMTTEENCGNKLVELIVSGHLELAVTGDAPGFELAPMPGLVLHPVVTEPVFALLPASHQLAELDEVPLTELAELEWTLPPRDDDRMHEYYAQVLSSHHALPRIAHQVEGNVIFDLVRDAGVASLCQATCRQEQGVVVRPITGSPLWYRHVLAWRSDGPLHEHGSRLAELAEQAYQEAVNRSPVYQKWLHLPR